MLFISQIARSNRTVLCEKRENLFVTLRQVVHTCTAAVVRERANSVNENFCTFT